MIEALDPKNIKQGEQLKRFNFFQVEKINEKIDDPTSHPIRLNDVSVGDIAMIGSRYLFYKVESYYKIELRIVYQYLLNASKDIGLLILGVF